MPDDPTAPAPAAQSQAAALTFRPFTKEDWYGFLGAERFADGAEPLMTEGRFILAAKRSWLLALDANGGCLLVDDDPQSDDGGYVLMQPFATQAEAQDWVQARVGEPAHLVDFLMAGFKAP